MTLEGFKKWVVQAAAWYRRGGSWMGGGTNREHADQIRPHDPVLADLYVQAADAQDAIRKHILSRVEE